MTKKEILNSLVKKEAKNLKDKAYKSELKKLDFDELDSTSKWKCVYGQMTGDCNSPRAEKLILNCATRVYNSPEIEKVDCIKEAKLNGPPEKGKRLDSEVFRDILLLYFSPIEVFIHKKANQKNGNNERLIKYLKGETKTLKFV